MRRRTRRNGILKSRERGVNARSYITYRHLFRIRSRLDLPYNAGYGSRLTFREDRDFRRWADRCRAVAPGSLHASFRGFCTSG